MRIDQLRAINQGRTPRNIRREANYIDFPGGIGGLLPQALGRVYDSQPNWQANGDYLVAAWNSLPALLAEVERLRAERDRIIETMRRWVASNGTTAFADTDQDMWELAQKMTGEPDTVLDDTDQ